MYSFEGQFRRRPTQSLGGASKQVERSSLLQRTQDERKQREALRICQKSALLIQTHYRSYRTRCQMTSSERELFDVECDRWKKGGGSLDINTLCRLTRQLLFFYRHPHDDPRLVWLCQTLIKQQVSVTRWISDLSTPGLHQMKKLLSINCRYLEAVAEGASSLAVPLRMLEVYCSPSSYNVPHSHNIVAALLHHLVHHGYFGCVRKLLVHRVPDSIEACTEPPTPLAASLLHFIQSPLTLPHSPNTAQLRRDVLRSVSSELLCPPHPPQVREFLLPVWAPSFPFTDLLHALNPLPGTPSVWLLLAILKLSPHHIGKLTSSELQVYLGILEALVPFMVDPSSSAEGADENSDVEDEAMDCSSQVEGECWAYRECVSHLDRLEQVKAVVSVAHSALPAVCCVCHHLLARCHFSIHKTRLLYSLAFNPGFLRKLWDVCCSVSTVSVTGAETSLLQMLSRGLQLSQSDMDKIIQLISVFSSLFSHSLTSLHDAEFYGEQSQSHSFMPFSVSELVPMTRVLCDVCLGVIELAHPDTKPALSDQYRAAFLSVGASHGGGHNAPDLRRQRHTWAYLFKIVAQLVKQLYARDSRRAFCPPGHWLASHLNIYANTPSQLYQNPNPVFVRRPFAALSALNPDRMLEEEGPPLSTTEVRKLTVLTELPFVVPFEERVKIFNKLVKQDKCDHQGEHYMGGPQINILVRRAFLYEDAFNRLSPENEPNLKLRMTVQLKNFAGLNEAGIDGGGIFREFMSLLLKTAFDPNRGFFQCTTDKLIYPNPQAGLLVEDYLQHFYFAGRILGKALYENMLVELPFASFFLSKILSWGRGDVDIHHLASLDPEMYKNLLFLKNYDGDVQNLDLDFTVVNNELGETKVEELKPGGRDIPVTNFNRIEYIHLMADYRLNRQIRRACGAFQQGLADVISLDWLRMFDHNELQVLISGAHVPIDIQDLKRHTNYSGGYSADHPVIVWFWQAVEQFTDHENSSLLKFVTSCSRPPLLGFKDLYPAFCIHYAGKEEARLPTASTCMNLLKLPEFPDFQTLQEKLLYALRSQSGFELS